MKIKTIKEIKNFAVFKDYKSPADTADLSKFNLFYGWNGSGKSTLSRVLYSISSKILHPSFPEGKFKVLAENDSEISEAALETSPFNLHVFNSDFVQRNVDFAKQKASSILILSEEKIEETKKLKLLQKELKETEKEFSTKKDNFDKTSADIDKLYTNIARNVKKSFELIQTSDNRLLNYKAPTLKQFISSNQSSINASAILSPDDVVKIKAATKSDQKPNLACIIKCLPFKQATVALESVKSSLSKQIAAKQIQRLVESSQINSWIEVGLSIHLSKQSQICEFCNSPLAQTRIDELNAHFSKDYQELTSALKQHRTYIENRRSELTAAPPDGASLYEELHAEFISARSNLDSSRETLTRTLDQVLELIDAKILNPFESIMFDPSPIHEPYKTFESRQELVNTVIKKHNQKNNNFSEEIKKAQYALELHFVSDLVLADDLLKQLKDYDNAAKTLAIETANLDKLRQDVTKLEGQLITEVKGAERFNDSLARFLGRRDISLKFDQAAKGYLLVRSGIEKSASDLSEGEKTAIAFVYFMTKLRESGNDIKDTLVVLDDPISSFDSNHLFHACSYIKTNLEASEQLIILTHNFQFFRLIRDWLKKKNDRKRNADGTVVEKIRSRFYSIETSAEPARHSVIKNAPESLLNFNSEYHYIFQKLHEFRNTTALDLEKSFLVANLSRKLLEGFLTFKFPSGRNDFYELLKAGCPSDDTREKVYKFINQYSHNQAIEFHDSPIDNLLGEGDNIASEVFKIVKDLDEKHYLEMEDVCSLNLGTRATDMQ